MEAAALVPSFTEVLAEVRPLPGAVLDEALAEAREQDRHLGAVLRDKGHLSDRDLAAIRARQYGLDLAESLPNDLDHFFTTRIAIGFLKKFAILPVATPETSYIAVADPAAFQPIDDLRSILHWDAMPVKVAPEGEILAKINLAYDLSRGAADQAMQDMDEEDAGAIVSELEDTTDLSDETSDAPVIRFVNLVLSQAVRARASDVHIEPFQHRLSIRQRVDGMLHEVFSPPKHVQSRLISRIKIMARMDIAEKRLPQDGRIELRIADRNVDIRVSTLPTAFGERVVMRLLDKSSALISLEDLGMSPGDLEIFHRLITASHGIILVTGPTGSGKTTTLYAALQVINRPEINIITVEDPIEYQIDGISQVQVNAKIDLTFANGLRTIVRQDPDVILIGEIRDLETAGIAIQSALTGHLVFSTLHTNDAAGAVTRLVDMGVESFLVTSSVNAIMAQRLVRRICPDCMESFRPDPVELQRVGIRPEDLPGGVLHRGQGCGKCMHTGYRGRVGIFEMLVLDDELRRLILTTSDANAIKQLALERGLVTLRRDGINKVLEGRTTLEEVFRVTRA